MAGPNKIPDHLQRMGTLVVNLQSLEFALRGFLYNREKTHQPQDHPDFLDHVEVGQQVELNAFTNWDTLVELIEKYNSEVGSKDSGLKVDVDLSRIRDALAHGRIASQSPLADVACKLVKYSKPKRGGSFVHVTDCHTLTKEWFDERIKWVYESIQKVSAANDCHHSSQ